jgi:hypothetical protein
MDFKNISKSGGSLFSKIGFDTLKLDDLDLDEIISDEFISKNTILASLKEFIEKSGFDVNSISGFKYLPIEKRDSFVKSISSFGSWRELLEKALAVRFGGSL